MIEVDPIATVRSPFTDNFGIPRQPGLCSDICGEIVFEKNNFNIEATRDLETFSHIWVIFYFHKLKKKPDKARIRPPRLGGNKYAGVFSSRSPYRPNSLGMSLVRLKEIIIRENELAIIISGHDLLNQTPVIDIKPFISSDIPEDNINFGWQNTFWEELEVVFEDDIDIPETLKKQLTQLLAQDPRPAYNSDCENKKYFMTFNNYEVCFSVNNKICKIKSVNAVTPPKFN